MKLIAALIGILAISGITLFSTYNNTLQSSETTQSRDYTQYTNWRMKHNKSHSADRFKIFQENLRIIEKHNASNSSFTLGLNVFADLTNEEYRSMYLMDKDLARPQRNAMKNKNSLRRNPTGDSINWVKKGAVTPVKNQGTCGSCWAFSAVGALEGAYEISSGNLTNLSEQQVTSCTPAPSYGCSGGWPSAAFEYVASAGIETAAAYPYEQEDDSYTHLCDYDESKTVFNNKGYETIEVDDVQSMLDQIQKQPLSVLVDAANVYFQLYEGGILTSEGCGTWTDHAILLTGYESSGDYWQCKNSWGTSWGDKGYVYIKNEGGSGVCGINETVTYPTF